MSIEIPIKDKVTIRVPIQACKLILSLINKDPKILANTGEVASMVNVFRVPILFKALKKNVSPTAIPRHPLIIRIIKFLRLENRSILNGKEKNQKISTFNKLSWVAEKYFVCSLKNEAKVLRKRH